MITKKCQGPGKDLQFLEGVLTLLGLRFPDGKLPQANVAKTTWTDDVYPPSDDSFILVDALADLLRTRKRPLNLCLEIGCGSGFVITSLALMLKSLKCCPHIMATDVNPAATQATMSTLIKHSLDSVDVIMTDLIKSISPSAHGQVDLLLFNPPYVPTPSEEVVRDGIARAWAGGTHGREVIDRLLPDIPSILAPGGNMLMVVVSENDPQGIIDEMVGMGLNAEIALVRSADEERLHVLKFSKSVLD